MEIRSIILSLTACLFVPLALAQTVVTGEDLFAIGSRYRVAVDRAPMITPGENGPGQEWSFPELHPHTVRVLEVLPPSASRSGGPVPVDRVLADMDNGIAYHLTLDTGVVLLHGHVVHDDGDQEVLRFDPPVVLLNMPARYYQFQPGRSRASVVRTGDRAPGHHGSSGAPSKGGHVAYHSETSGWGTVNTPLGTFPAVKHILRIKIEREGGGDGQAHEQPSDAPSAVTEHMTIFSWWSPRFALPLLVLVDEGSDDTIDRAEWIEAELSAGKPHDPADRTAVEVYPPPTIERVSIAPVDPFAASYTIHDKCGRLVRQGRLMSERQSIVLSDLGRGAYRLRVEQGGFVVHTRLLVH